MKKVTDFLGLAIEGKEVLKAARAQSVLKRWEEAVGPLLASKTHIDRYDHGVLLVEAEGSAWAQELRLNSETVVFRLNEMAGEKLFQKIRVSQTKGR